MTKNKVLALIPARKGSKGIKNKNLYPVNKIPLIEYTLDAAKKSKVIDHIYISTDSEEISAKYQKEANIIKRPNSLSTDSAKATSVVSHFIKSIEAEMSDDFYIIYLQPTSPLRTSKHIDESFAMMIDAGKKNAVSLVKNRHTPFKFFEIKNGSAFPLFSEERSNFNRQDLPVTYRTNGAIWIFKKSLFLLNETFPTKNGFPYIMSYEDSIDIDSINDILKVEKQLQKVV